MKLAVRISLIISILHSILFYETKLGISVVLFAITLAFAIISILTKSKKVKNKKAFILAVPIILLSSTYFIYNNMLFYIMNIIVISLLFVTMTIMALTEQITIKKVTSKAFLMVFGAFDYLGKAIKEIGKYIFGIKDNKAEEHKKENKKKKTIKQILIGCAIAIPILIIVISLLLSADIIMKEAIEKGAYFILTTISIETITSLICRIAIIICLFIYLVALILNLIKKDSIYNEDYIEETDSNQEYKINIEGIIINTVLTLLNIIYLIFTITQTIYFTQQISEVGNLNYAEYARTGFFQLMLVSVINFAIIFITRLNEKKVSKANSRYTKGMNIVLAIFTIIILVLSILRMNLYEQAYGYTFLRLMVYFIQITELILIIPTIAYIINKKVKIIRSYIIILICAYIVINYVNIDKIIAKQNIDRYFKSENIETAEIDYYYLQNNLSTDAVPEMIRLLEVKDEKVKDEMKNYFRKLKVEIEKEERKWQEYNISIERAKEEIQKLDLTKK